jgi:hypothetical protein
VVEESARGAEDLPVSSAIPARPDPARAGRVLRRGSVFSAAGLGGTVEEDGGLELGRLVWGEMGWGGVGWGAEDGVRT